MKIMFSSLATPLETMSIRSVIKPYSIRTKLENAEYVSTAGNSMSLETKIKILDEVDNVQDEVDLINKENALNANQGNF